MSSNMMKTCRMMVLGRALDAAPVNITLQDVVERIRGLRGAHVILEPGDATRYELCLLPLLFLDTTKSVGGHLREDTQHLWLVMRPSPGGGRGSDGVIVDARYPIHGGELIPLSRGNEHTRALLTEWVGGIFEAARQANLVTGLREEEEQRHGP